MPEIQSLTEDGLARNAVLREAGRALRIHYTDAGPQGSDVPVLALLHGSGPGTTGWGAFVANRPAFLAQGYRLICPDFPGWGRSDPLVCEEDRAALNARALHAVLEHAGVHQPIAVLGSSMGAHSAVSFARQWPERVRKMILVAGGTGGRSSFHASPPEGVRRMMAFYERPSVDTMRSFLEAVMFDASPLTDDFVQARLAAALSRPEHLQNFALSWTRRPQQFADAGGALEAITVPTLAIWGREDRVVPLDIGLHIVARIPGSDFLVLGRCGHVPHIERADEVNQQVVRFLAG